MDAQLFTQMLADKEFHDLKRMQYKYSHAEVAEMLYTMRNTMYTDIPLKDFHGNPIVYLDSVSRVKMSAIRLLVTPQSGVAAFGLQAMEDEIHNTLKIENIDSSRDSIRRILCGYAPITEDENRILGMKKGLEFISNRSNRINEDNLHELYQLTVGDFLDSDNLLLPNAYYRHDHVYVIGGKDVHEGLSFEKLPTYMNEFVAFIQEETAMDDLVKAALIHFYFAYLHPYFDGNGRTARLLHLWYLVQRGYSSAMFVPFSSYINDTRSGYYKAYQLVEANAAISGMIDVTPFLTYFIENIYNRLETATPQASVLAAFADALAEGQVTEKEKALWNFVLTAYGMNEFSTKQLERDFGNAAYGTIRNFVIKFEERGLLQKQKYSNRPRYSVAATKVDSYEG